MNDDLNRALAEAMGWRVRNTPSVGPALYEVPRGQRDWEIDGCSLYGGYANVPDFATSLDALRDGPERVLREAGAWEIVAAWFRTSAGVEAFEATIHMHGFATAFAGRGATEAEARARAALAALTDQREQVTQEPDLDHRDHAVASAPPPSVESERPTQ